VRLNLIRLGQFRGFTSAEWRPGPGFNLVLGGNGAGKTSLLEAAHLLAHGRSFRGRVRDGLVRSGAEALEVYAEWIAESGPGRTRRAGLRHGGQAWEARMDGARVGTLADLCAEIAVVSFEPGSHELVTGPAEVRRRFLDWSLFHVEPDFLPCWRRYARALRQRNALLKARAAAAALDPWDEALAEAGERLHGFRDAHVGQWRPGILEQLQAVLPELGGARLGYAPGWRQAERSLIDSLRQSRDRDLALGYTVSGPHRADWRVDFDALPGREALSRGQGKLVALAAVLSQAALFAAVRGEWPVIALDDLGSELDAEHQRRVLSGLSDTPAQVLITGTEPPTGLSGLGLDLVVFHVEQGAVRAGPAAAGPADRGSPEAL